MPTTNDSGRSSPGQTLPEAALVMLPRHLELGAVSGDGAGHLLADAFFGDDGVLGEAAALDEFMLNVVLRPVTALEHLGRGELHERQLVAAGRGVLNDPVRSQWRDVRVT